MTAISKSELIAASVITLGGVYIGYEIGHRSQPDTSDEKFIKNMQNPGLWSGANDDFRRLYVFYYRPCISNVIDQVDLKNYPPIFGPMRKKPHPEVEAAACAAAKKEIDEWKRKREQETERKSTKPKGRKLTPLK